MKPIAPATLLSRFSLPKMDCPSEEQLVRLALEALPAVQGLEVDLRARTITVSHGGEVAAAAVLDALAPLGLGAALLESAELLDSTPPLDAAGVAAAATPRPTAQDESRVLWQLLTINATMFAIELTVGWLADSAGLLADSLDMGADAAVYGIGLFAVGRGAREKRRAARISGVAESALAVGALGEVIRRAIFGSDPASWTMMAMATVALVANLACVALLHRHRHGGVHMQASWIFSTNDALANLGVIVAGGLVALTGSTLPDLVIGAIIAALVLRGAMRILRLP